MSWCYCRVSTNEYLKYVDQVIDVFTTTLNVIKQTFPEIDNKMEEVKGK